MRSLWSYLPRWTRLPGRAAPLSPAAERWRATLKAAAAVPFYTRWRKELARAAHASTDEERRAALLRLPEVELDYFFGHFRQFRGKESNPPLVRESRPIWPAECRIAAVAPWFHIGGSAKLFLTPDTAEIQKFAPEVIAAPIDVLETLAATPWPRESPLFALVALCGVGTPILSAAMRDRFWRAFGVPVYLQFRGFQGEPLARECEAHDGIHFDPADVIFERRPSGELLLTSLANPRHTVLRLATRLHAWIDMRPCGCGLATPRLVDLVPAAATQTITYRVPSTASLHALAGAVGNALGGAVEDGLAGAGQAFDSADDEAVASAADEALARVAGETITSAESEALAGASGDAFASVAGEARARLGSDTFAGPDRGTDAGAPGDAEPAWEGESTGR